MVDPRLKMNNSFIAEFSITNIMKIEYNGVRVIYLCKDTKWWSDTRIYTVVHSTMYNFFVLPTWLEVHFCEKSPLLQRLERFLHHPIHQFYMHHCHTNPVSKKGRERIEIELQNVHLINVGKGTLDKWTW